MNRLLEMPPRPLFLAGGLAVHAFAQGDRGELLICRLLLVQIGREKPHNIVMAERFCPGYQGPVARDLIVHRLRGAHDRGIEDFLVRHLTCDLVTS